MDFPEYNVRSSVLGNCSPSAGLGDGRISDTQDCEETFVGILGSLPSYVMATDNSKEYLSSLSSEIYLAVYYPNRSHRCHLYYINGSRSNSPIPALLYNARDGSTEVFSI